MCAFYLLSLRSDPDETHIIIGKLHVTKHNEKSF